MKREEVKKLLPIIKAFSEGETIQHLDIINDKWEDVDEFVYHGRVKSYRIKPDSQPKFRPFKDAEECWQEMLKHKPFGWVKDKVSDEYINVYCVSNNSEGKELLKQFFKRYVFIDKNPFGVKDEED